MEGLNFPLPCGDKTTSWTTWREAKETTGSCTALQSCLGHSTMREGKPLWKGVCLKLLFPGSNSVRDYFPGTEALCWSTLFVRWFTATKCTQVLICPWFSYKSRAVNEKNKNRFHFSFGEKSTKQSTTIKSFLFLLTGQLLFCYFKKMLFTP